MAKVVKKPENNQKGLKSKRREFNWKRDVKPILDGIDEFDKLGFLAPEPR